MSESSAGPVIRTSSGRFVRDKTDVTTRDTAAVELSPLSEGPEVRLRIAYGLTLNMSNFEFARCDVEITVPCHPDDVDLAYEHSKLWLESKLAAEVRQIREHRPKAGAELPERFTEEKVSGG